MVGQPKTSNPKAEPKVSPGRRKGRKSLPEPRTNAAEPPSGRSLRAAAKLNKKLKRRAAKVRFDFVRSGNDGLSPLARMLRGGQGGEVRLKLLLSLLWVGGGGDERHMTRPYRAISWAALLDLPDPRGSGTRRVRDAMQWLEREGFVEQERVPGRAKSFHLLLEDGTKRDYFDPAKHAHEQKESGAQVGHYISLPSTFWTDGWIQTLSGRAVAMLLILASETYGATTWKAISPSRARERYVISEDTWSKGVKELKERGLILVKKVPIIWEDFDEDFDEIRVRNLYRVPRRGHHIQLPDPPFDVAAAAKLGAEQEDGDGASD